MTKVTATDPQSKQYSSRNAKAGLPPGSLVYVGSAPEFKPYIEHFEYAPTDARKFIIEDPNTFEFNSQTDQTHWVTLFGIHDIQVIEQLGKIFQLHPLLLEDILNTEQRPNAEQYDDVFYASLKMVRWDDASKAVRSEHISILLRENLVLLFQEKPGDVYDDLRYRIESGKGLLRAKGSDYLFYRLLDSVVDQYFVIIEHLHHRIERIEVEILTHHDHRLMMRLIRLRKQILELRGHISPLREYIALIERMDRAVMKKETVPYLRDLNAHIKEVVEMLDLEREGINGLIDLYMSVSDQKLNNVMRVLTVISTIFIPLTFIAGVYGMNFDVMPELHYAWAYPVIWGIMISIAVALLFFFRKKKWL